MSILPAFLKTDAAAWAWAQDNVDLSIDDSDKRIAKIQRDQYQAQASEYAWFARDTVQRETLNLWRMVCVKSSDAIQTYNLGKAWSVNRSAAGCYGSHSFRPGEREILIEGVVQTSDIDWAYGFTSFLYYGESQWEVSMDADAPVQIVSIDGKRYDPPIAGNTGHASEEWKPASRNPIRGFDILPAGTVLFHGSHAPVKPGEKPMWFTRGAETANDYGPHITTFTTTRDARLFVLDSFESALRQLGAKPSHAPSRDLVSAVQSAGFDGYWYRNVGFSEEIMLLRPMTFVSDDVDLARSNPIETSVFRPGDRVFFEYHCWQSEESCDAKLWHHTRQYATMVRVIVPPEIDEEVAPMYEIRFDDGLTYDVNSDEVTRRPVPHPEKRGIVVPSRRVRESERSELEARIELTCVQLPDDPTEEEVERTIATRSMWQRAQDIADRMGGWTNFSEHRDEREACLFGDAYVYLPLRVLEPMLDAFDRERVEYDNIDLPSDASKSLVARLRSRFPRESVVDVNVGKMFEPAREATEPTATWYHLTDRARFKLDPRFMPADNALAIENRSGRPGIYLAQDVEQWLNGMGYWRPFVVELQVDPSVISDPGVHGRWGGEMFVPASSFDKLRVKRVIPLDAYARETYGEPGWIESGLGVEFDTGQPIMARYKGYRYAGPDVRVMPAADVERLKKDLRRVKRRPAHETNEGIGVASKTADVKLTARNQALVDRYGQGTRKVVKIGKLPPEYRQAVAAYWEQPVENVPLDLPVGIATLPMKALTSAIMHDQDLAEYHGHFGPFHDWFMQVHGAQVPMYQTRWPVLLLTSDWKERDVAASDVILEDGWHRLHSYYAQGDKLVAAMWIVGFEAEPYAHVAREAKRVPTSLWNQPDGTVTRVDLHRFEDLTDIVWQLAEDLHRGKEPDHAVVRVRAYQDFAEWAKSMRTDFDDRHWGVGIYALVDQGRLPEQAKNVYDEPEIKRYLSAAGLTQDDVYQAGFDRHVELLAEAIQRGQDIPPLVTLNGEPRDGRHRTLAALSLGLRVAPVLEVAETYVAKRGVARESPIAEVRLTARNQSLVDHYGQDTRIIEVGKLPPEYRQAVAAYFEQPVDAVPVDLPVGVTTLPMQALTSAACSQGDFGWYHRWFMSMYGYEAPKPGPRWPVVLATGDAERTLADGWHRLHHYYEQGDKLVPAIWIIGFEASSPQHVARETGRDEEAQALAFIRQYGVVQTRDLFENGPLPTLAAAERVVERLHRKGLIVRTETARGGFAGWAVVEEPPVAGEAHAAPDPAAAAIIERAGILGTSGDCGAAAMAINTVVFDGKGQYLVAIPKEEMLESKQADIDHVGVLHRRKIYDADGVAITRDYLLRFSDGPAVVVNMDELMGREEAERVIRNSLPAPMESYDEKVRKLTAAKFAK